MSALLENYQKAICIYCCSLIRGGRSFRASNLFHTFKKKQDLSPWIGEQPCMQIYFWQVSRNADICVIPGKLSAIHLHIWLFSHPQGKVLFIVVVRIWEFIIWLIADTRIHNFMVAADSAVVLFELDVQCK